MTEPLRYSGGFWQNYKIEIANKLSLTPFSRDDGGFRAAIGLLRIQQSKIMPKPLPGPESTLTEIGYTTIYRGKVVSTSTQSRWISAERTIHGILVREKIKASNALTRGEYADALRLAHHLHYRRFDPNLERNMHFHAFLLSRDAHLDFWVHLMERFPGQHEVEYRRPLLEEIVRNMREKRGEGEIEIEQYRKLREMLNYVALEGSVMGAAAREWVDSTALVGGLGE